MTTTVKDPMSVCIVWYLEKANHITHALPTVVKEKEDEVEDGKGGRGVVGMAKGIRLVELKLPPRFTPSYCRWKYVSSPACAAR